MRSCSHHRVHHDRRVHKNYGGLLIIWDKLFGSFVDECDRGDGTADSTGVGCPTVADGDERVVYGILVGPYTWNPFTVQVRCRRSCCVVAPHVTAHARARAGQRVLCWQSIVPALRHPSVGCSSITSSTY